MGRPRKNPETYTRVVRLLDGPPKKSLAASEAPEPVAWMVLHDGEFDYFVYANKHEAESAADINNTLATPLYVAPPDQSARIAELEGWIEHARGEAETRIQLRMRMQDERIAELEDDLKNATENWEGAAETCSRLHKRIRELKGLLRDTLEYVLPDEPLADDSPDGDLIKRIRAALEK